MSIHEALRAQRVKNERMLMQLQQEARYVNIEQLVKAQYESLPTQSPSTTGEPFRSINYTFYEPYNEKMRKINEHYDTERARVQQEYDLDKEARERERAEQDKFNSLYQTYPGDHEIRLMGIETYADAKSSDPSVRARGELNRIWLTRQLELIQEAQGVDPVKQPVKKKRWIRDNLIESLVLGPLTIIALTLITLGLFAVFSS